MNKELEKYEIGFSELTERVFLGKSKKLKNHSEWISKKDITSQFIQVMEQKFPINTTQNISVNGVNKYRVIIVDMDKEVIINGKSV
jgi:hypothetical protein